MSFLLSNALIHLIVSIYYTIFIDTYKLFRQELSFLFHSHCLYRYMHLTVFYTIPLV